MELAQTGLKNHPTACNYWIAEHLGLNEKLVEQVRTSKKLAPVECTCRPNVLTLTEDEQEQVSRNFARMQADIRMLLDLAKNQEGRIKELEDILHKIHSLTR